MIGVLNRHTFDSHDAERKENKGAHIIICVHVAFVLSMRHKRNNRDCRGAPCDQWLFVTGPACLNKVITADVPLRGARLNFIALFIGKVFFGGKMRFFFLTIVTNNLTKSSKRYWWMLRQQLSYFTNIQLRISGDFQSLMKIFYSWNVKPIERLMDS